MTTEIITGMPLPPMHKRGAQPKYPWLQLRPGDAFKFAPGVTMNGARSMASQNSAGIKLAVRSMPDGIYCWRIDGTPHADINGNYRQEVQVIRDYGATATPAMESLIVGYEHKPQELGEHRRFVERGEPIVPRSAPMPMPVDITSNEAAMARLRAPYPGQDPVTGDDET